ncbi:glutamine amidotransferase-related protein [Enterobacteriaceae endosymbiont of Macroplea appendiculata]|uniref:glutamine amidotransferase-related protein n=1 Tax=Enterobacteriaceae endosymbiont of Macroplea appendiculata TaxID=2675790 RepID=UPI001448D89C|nr:gamma-glutamyl-gamma-aminobutyrate hydrolase family protein [Enterobacteriaceae endosymbiont of Macroplea appendiculata]QJC30722.1 anthranilate synthase component II [Enterobacteriaceae endosymbiont of Macroplea appendiculata]
MSNIFLLDNFDSFTYNLVDQLRCLGHTVIIYRNNININILLQKIKQIHNPILILSPGPGIPKNAGYMPYLLQILIGKMPIIGICLGYQALIELYNGTIMPLNNILHGQATPITHDMKHMFKNIKNPMYVARYHSLIVKNMPQMFTINSRYKNIIMSFRYEKKKICGYQFHPESILTPEGSILLEQTIIWASNYYLL